VPNGRGKTLVLENDAEATSAGMVFRAVAPGVRVAVVGRRDGRVFILKDRRPVAAPVRAFDSGVTAVALSPDESRALIGDEHGELVELTISDGHVRVIPQAIAFGPGGWFATGSADRTMKLWDATGQPIFTVRHGSGLRKLSISTDGTLLTVSFEQERAVRRWHLDRLQTAVMQLGLLYGFR
jgi:WD40 repeat protein